MKLFASYVGTLSRFETALVQDCCYKQTSVTVWKFKPTRTLKSIDKPQWLESKMFRKSWKQLKNLEPDVSGCLMLFNFGTIFYVFDFLQKKIVEIYVLWNFWMFLFVSKVSQRFYKKYKKTNRFTNNSKKYNCSPYVSTHFPKVSPFFQNVPNISQHVPKNIPKIPREMPKCPVLKFF